MEKIFQKTMSKEFHKFTPASELKKQFRVSGHFYDMVVDGIHFPCRSILEISADTAAPMELDFVVIMMNPGASRPVDPEYIPETVTPSELRTGKWKRELIPTVPDPTQYQIMRLMEVVGAKRVQVFNLCDLRNGNSQRLKQDHAHASECDPTASFSVTNPSRISELKATIESATLVLPILGWGENSVLREYAERALAEFPNHLGVERLSPWFSHPSPMMKTHKLRWLAGILEQIN